MKFDNKQPNASDQEASLAFSAAFTRAIERQATSASGELTF
jgi:hypothetical protein